MTAAATKELPVLQRVSRAGGALSRREIVRQLVAGISAGAVWPLAAAAHPIYGHFQDAIFERAENLSTAGWKPVFLSAQQNESLIALAEAIVPGSAKAEVNRFLDLLLSVDKPENQRQFVESLAAFDAEAQARFGKNLSSLEDSQKNALLADASSEPRRDKDSTLPNATETKSGLHAHFENLKGCVSGAYYSSEAGMRELGWTGDYVFEKFPGCEHLEGHR
jgi:hypothetical protein